MRLSPLSRTGFRGDGVNKTGSIGPALAVKPDRRPWELRLGAVRVILGSAHFSASPASLGQRAVACAVLSARSWARASGSRVRSRGAGEPRPRMSGAATTSLAERTPIRGLGTTPGRERGDVFESGVQCRLEWVDGTVDL